MRSLLVLSLIAWLAANPSPARAEPPKFSASFRKAEDSLQTTLTNTGGVFRITTKSGIGDATIKRDSGAWPKTIRIELTVTSLESFTVQTDVCKLSAAPGFKDSAVFHFDRKGEELPDAKGAVFTLEFRKRGDRLIEVTLPPGLCTPNTKVLKADWIDAFRG